MTSFTAEDAIEMLRDLITRKCPQAEVERDESAFPDAYDGHIIIRLPTDWTPGRVSDFREWARAQAYELVMSKGVDILVDGYNLTRNEEELVKWIFIHYPDVQEESLPESQVHYNRDAARELYYEHDERLDERLIGMSPRTEHDRKYIESKYTSGSSLRFGT